MRYIALHDRSPRIVGTVFEVALQSKAQGVPVTIVDVSTLSGLPHWSPTVWVMSWVRRCGRGSSIRTLVDESRRAGVEYLNSGSTKSQAYRRQARSVLSEIGSEFEDLRKYEPFHGMLGLSLGNWLADLRKDSRPPLHKNRRLVVRQVSEFLAIHDIFSRLLLGEDAHAEVVVWNGRSPHYAAVWAAATDFGIRPYFCDIGAREDSFFFERCSPHDRIAVQSIMVSDYRDRTGPDRESAVRAWLSERRTDRRVNVFLQTDGRIDRGTPSVLDDGDDTERHQVTLFTSSPDETVSAPGDWETGDWNSQNEALIAAAHLLVNKGYDVVVRLHPNLVNKSWREYLREVKSYDRKSLTLVLPTDQVDSYRLVSESDAVFVWGSTVGLEAVAAGVPTYTLGDTFYDLTADVRRIASMRDLVVLGDFRYEVNRVSAYPAVSWLTSSGRHQYRSEILGMIASLNAGERRFSGVMKVIDRLWIVAYLRSLRLGPAAWLRICERFVGYEASRRFASRVTRSRLMGRSSRDDLHHA